MTIKFKRTEQLKLPTAILGADIRSEDQQVIAACFDGIYQFHAEDNSKTAASKKIAEHESYASGARWLNDNHWVTAGYDGNLLFSNLDSADPPTVIDAHKFWSWHLAVSPQRDRVASCTGQYLAGGYKYEPAEESEPCVRVFDINGDLKWSFSHVPSVHTVSFSSDGQLLAAANLMGEVRVWDLNSGDQIAQWTTPDFTSWGIIKSHCYIGGIHASAFHRSRPELFVAGMGPMRDPMAGNGKQRWQAFEWQSEEPTKIRNSDDDQTGEGLMETLAVHPDKEWLVMAGRLRGGAWNVGLFDSETAELLASHKTGYRVTHAQFVGNTDRLMLVGTQGQPKPDEKKRPLFGRFEIYELQPEVEEPETDSEAGK